MIDVTVLLGILMSLSFFVNIVVQITKEFIHIPTKIWTILVSAITVVLSLCVATSFEWIEPNVGMVVLSLAGSFIVAYVAMYGFDTFKELWLRFKEGENIGS